MESWQKELKDLIGTGGAELYTGNYYGNADNPVIVYLRSGGVLSFDIKRKRAKEIIATHILPNYPDIVYVGTINGFPYFGGGSISLTNKFIGDINSVKSVADDVPGSISSSADADDVPGSISSSADTTPLLIMIIIVLAVWYMME